ncbi:putative membrane protein [Streptosporangium becharense]|uniref:Putative membrane protein n=1 Tax=Streptosporangium becharense TaxID=1816182 RepID=A0A7W9IL12_9ACTN|nr:DUF4142 domain-containing protein [Streptosporangium becharense]MBB2911474.1 putative membrane protein [Streptosporangium becharense]MBB5822708.1 putative membrane protein [Streptosporangium becharense]
MIILLAAAVTVLGGTAGTTGSPPALSKQDRAFLVQAHQSNLAEIAAGRAAQEKTGGQEVRETGEAVREMGMKLVGDHTKLDADVRRVADQLGVELPDEPSQEQRRQLEEVKAKSGADFDRAWIAAQVAGHRQSLADGRKELQEGSAPEVKKLATDAEPVVQEHLDMLLKVQAGESPGMTESPSPDMTESPEPSPTES